MVMFSTRLYSGYAVSEAMVPDVFGHVFLFVGRAEC